MVVPSFSYLNTFASFHRLQGKSFLLPSDSKEGQHAKPRKPRKLALPQTYVTKRGEFTVRSDTSIVIDVVYGIVSKGLNFHQLALCVITRDRLGVMYGLRDYISTVNTEAHALGSTTEYIALQA